MPTYEEAIIAVYTRDLLGWLKEEGKPTEGIEVIAAVGLLSRGDAPEYAVVLYRDASGNAHVWTARQYQEPWSTEQALAELENRVRVYEDAILRSRQFLAAAREALG